MSRSAKHLTKSTALTTTSALAALGLIGGVLACADQQPTGVQSARAPRAPSRAVVVADRPVLTLAQDADGAYLLDRACDVFIGEQVVLPPDAPATKYEHQALVQLAPGSKVRLVGDAAMQASGSKTFTCDATDRNADGTPVLDANGNPQPVIDPVTLHPAKGNGPEINTDGIDFDLNGYSIASAPGADVLTGDPTLANGGIFVSGANVTIHNSSADVSLVSKFGHSFDIQGASPTLKGTVTAGVYNIETTGGLTLRNFSGTALIDGVKSVDTDAALGEGLFVRRCGTAKTTISNNYLVGGVDGLGIRECGNITVTGNTIGSNGTGEGITTREATSSATAPTVIKGNVIDGNGTNGIQWGRDSRSTGGLVISGNTIRNSPCGFALNSRNTSIAPLSLSGIGSANTFVNTPARTCSVR